MRTCGNEGDYCGTYRRPCGLWLRSFTTCCRLDRKARWIPITTLAAEETDEIVLRALSLWALFFARGHKICQLAGTQTQRIMTLRERKATRRHAPSRLLPLPLGVGCLTVEAARYVSSEKTPVACHLDLQNDPKPHLTQESLLVVVVYELNLPSQQVNRVYQMPVSLICGI